MSQRRQSFAERLAAAERWALHLELRDSYGVENEADAFAAFRRGEWTEALELEDRREWVELIGAAKARGVSVRRARIVSMPVTEYIRYEHAGTQLNVDAGEEVRWLERRQASTLQLPGNDFWLFDEALLQFNVFDGPGNWAHTDFTEDPEVIAFCLASFEAVWSRAAPHSEFKI